MNSIQNVLHILPKSAAPVIQYFADFQAIALDTLMLYVEEKCIIYLHREWNPDFLTKTPLLFREAIPFLFNVDYDNIFIFKFEDKRNYLVKKMVREILQTNP